MTTTQMHLLFPTMVMEYNGFSKHNDVKQVFWKNHKTHVYNDPNYQGYTGPDGFGKVLSHHDLEMEPLWLHIVECCKNYISQTGTDYTMYEYSITKCFVNALDDIHTNQPHSHGESHLSFIYYLNTVEQNQLITFFDRRERYMPYEGFDAAKFDKTQYNPWECNFSTHEVSEEKCFVFPSTLNHGVSWCNLEKDSKALNEPWVKDRNKLEDLKTMRISIVGDVILTTKETSELCQVLQPLKNWRTFS